MRYYLFLLTFFFSSICLAQNEPLVVVDEMPRFPGCEIDSATVEEKSVCSNQELLRFIYKNIVYPDSAIIKNTEGSVVIRFVVKADGSIGETTILKDIGDGCGVEAKRVVELMNKEGMVWTPGKLKGENKDVYFNLPVKFKIEEPAPDYVLIDADTVYTKYHTAASYNGGHEALEAFIQEKMTYPTEWIDSCAVGVIACDVLIRPNGYAVVMESYNYANLPEEFIYEAIHLIAITSFDWTIATHSGKPVSTIYPIRVTFAPSGNACSASLKRMNTSLDLGESAVTLYNDGKVEEAISKWDAAIEAFPESVEFRMWRGSVQVENSNFEAACPDLKAVKAVLGNSGYDHLLPLICQEKQE